MKTTFALLALLLPALLTAQSIERQLIGTTGGSMTGTSFSSDYSVGEVVVQTLTSSGIILTQGFQQPPYEPTPVNELPEPFSITLFPNPGPGIVHLYLGREVSGPVVVEAYNIVGQRLFGREIIAAGEVIDLDFSHLATGTYYLHVSTGNRKSVSQFIKVSK